VKGKIFVMGLLFCTAWLALCESPQHDKLISAGGAYRTEVYAKHSQLFLSIALECESPGRASAKIHPAS